MNEQKSIGIIAGSGQFPLLVAEEAKKQGLRVIVCGFYGHTDEATFRSLQTVDVFKMVHLGQLSKTISFFKDHDVRDLCFAGAISKPKALDLRPDFRAVKLLFSLKNKGDDAIFRGLIQELSQEGISVCAVADMVPSLRCPAGLLTKKEASEQIMKDIAYALPIGKSLGAHDIGQCLIVREGMVMAIECLEGTDATIKRGAELGGKACVAVKMCKQGQDKRIDLPSVGLETVRLLIENNYACLAIEAHNTLFFDREKALELANEKGLVVFAFEGQ